MTIGRCHILKNDHVRILFLFELIESDWIPQLLDHVHHGSLPNLRICRKEISLEEDGWWWWCDNDVIGYMLYTHFHVAPVVRLIGPDTFNVSCVYKLVLLPVSNLDSVQRCTAPLLIDLQIDDRAFNIPGWKVSWESCGGHQNHPTFFSSCSAGHCLVFLVSKPCQRR